MSTGPVAATASGNRGVAGQPLDLRLARVDRHDVVARPPQRRQHAVRRPARIGRRADHRDPRARAQQVADPGVVERAGSGSAPPGPRSASPASPGPRVQPSSERRPPGCPQVVHPPSTGSVRSGRSEAVRALETMRRFLALCRTLRRARPMPRGARDLRRSSRCTSLSGWSRSARLRPFSSPPVAVRGQPPPRPAGSRQRGACERGSRQRVRGGRSPSEAAVDYSGYKACVAFDTGGLGDKGFNDLAKKGLEDAEALGYQTAFSEAQGATDYAANIQRLIDEGCQSIVTVGFNQAQATIEAVKANPTSPSPRSTRSGTRPANGPTPANFTGLDFQIDEAATLAGLPRGRVQPESGKIGTYGGQQFPGVTRFMDGLDAGINIHNEKKGTTVALLGWDAAAQTGTFVGGDNPWGDPAKGEQLAKTFLDQGVDIVHPVAGATGNGTIKAMLAAGKWAIGVDTDQAISLAEYAPRDPDLGREGHRRRGPRHVQEERRWRHGRRELRRHAGQRRRPHLAVPRPRLGGLRRAQGRGRAAVGGHRRRHRQGRRLPQVADDRQPTSQRRPASGLPRRAACIRIVEESMRLELKDITKHLPGRPRQRPDLDLGGPRARCSACWARTAPGRPP